MYLFPRERRRDSIWRCCFVLAVWLSLLTGRFTSGSPHYDCHGCRCTELAGRRLTRESLAINCSNLGLTSVPPFIRHENYSSYNSLTLNLDGNDISYISSDDFKGLRNIKKLTLSHNKLSYIEDYAFVDVTRFDLLDLSFNNLSNSSFAEFAFYGDGGITQLDLSHNSLECPPKGLAQRSHMTDLSFNHNPMGPVLRDDAFEGYSTRIISLSLTDCQLRSIEPDVLPSSKFPALRTLFLDNNHFEELDANFLRGAVVRHELTLTNCGIREIRNRAFTHFLSFETLRLSHNNLSDQLSRNSFSKITITNLFLNNCSLNRIRKGFLRASIRNIDLSHNNIKIIRKDSFKGLIHLRTLDLNFNSIERITGQPFTNLTDLRELNLQRNLINDSSLAFLGYHDKLYNLDISHNRFSKLPDVSRLSNLHKLIATNNLFTNVDKDAFANNGRLERLFLSFNSELSTIDRQAFNRNHNLREMDLSFSGLRRLPSFNQLGSLTTLKLQNSRLQELPSDFCRILPNLAVLDVSDNYLESIPDLIDCTRLVELYLRDNRIYNITRDSFRGLSKLEIITLQHNRISNIDSEAFRGLRLLLKLRLDSNNLTTLPSNLFVNLTHLETLYLQRNRIRNLPHNIFHDLIHLTSLYINDNEISEVGDVVFSPNMTWLQELNISNNPLMSRFPIPTHGYPFLHTLSMTNLPLLLGDIPSIDDVPRVQTVNFTYSYHCCIFKDFIRDTLILTFPPEEDGPTTDSDIHFFLIHTPAEPVTHSPEVVNGLLFPEIENLFDPNSHGLSPEEVLSRLGDVARQWNASLVLLPNDEVLLVSNTNGTENAVYLSESQVEYLHSLLPVFDVKQEVDCYPLPNSLAPCENLLDPQPLPVLVWLIWFTAVISNLAVLFVTLVSKEKIEVPQFFICNLAFADFLLGIYIAFLGAVDVRTRGKSFYKSALAWQMGPGCQSAGFIAIFASELSVFVLTAMTLERLHTIAYSFKRGRIKLRHAVVVVAIGWIFAGSLALLPILDVNTYSTVAVCLPFRTGSARDNLFIALILTLNMTAFLVILSCYLHILRLFCRSPAAEQGGKKERVIISLKMGLLVLTNLICWLPLATVGYAAIAGEYIIDLMTAKFFVILILPLNACFNPFIYSILTKQFMMRVRNICKRTDNKLQLVNQSSLKLSFRRNSIASGSDAGSVNRTNSPRCDIDYDLLNKRQSRRSFSVQLTPQMSPGAVGTSSCPAAPRLGRRYSSPAIFTDLSTPPVTSGSRQLGFRLPGFSEGADHTPPRLSVGGAAGSPSEHHRTHNSSYLSIVHEESDVEPDEEEGPKILETRLSTNPLATECTLIQRYHSDPELDSLQRVSLKELISRRDQVADREQLPPVDSEQCTLGHCYTQSPSHCHHRSGHLSVPLQITRTLSVGSTAESVDQSAVTGNELSLNCSSAGSSDCDQPQYIQIINPHVSKLSKQPFEETQV